MENDITEQKTLNSTQVAQTSLLIDILKKKPYQKIGDLVKQLGITKSKISDRTFYRLVDKLFIVYGIKITLSPFIKPCNLFAACSPELSINFN